MLIPYVVVVLYTSKARYTYMTEFILVAIQWSFVSVHLLTSFSIIYVFVKEMLSAVSRAEPSGHFFVIFQRFEI